MMGESLRGYRRRVLKLFQQHSPDFAKVDLALIRDPMSFDVAERTIFADAVRASSDNTSQGPGVLREMVRYDQAGRPITEFVGSWRSSRLAMRY
jgi:hypothetical protein